MTRKEAALWAAYAISRGLIFLFLEPRLSDVGYYFQAAANAEMGRLPYRDFPFEYPPLAFFFLYLPMWILAPASDPLELQSAAGLYPGVFRAGMLLADYFSFRLFLGTLRTLRPQNESAAGWAYLLCTTLLSHLLLDRLDGLFLLALLFAVYAWKRSGGPDGRLWSILSGLGLGASIGLKWISCLTVPFFLIGGLRTSKRSTAAWLLGLLVGAGLPFGIAFALSGSGAFEFLGFHLARGVQIESVYASVAMLLRPLGLPAGLDHSFGSYNLASPASPYFAALSVICLLFVLGGAAFRLWRRREGLGAGRGAREAILVLCAATVLAKVLSPQYFLWILPLLLLAGAEAFSGRRFLLWAGASVLAAALTGWVFPYRYFGEGGLIPGLDPTALAILGLRNAVAAGMVLWLWTMGGGAGDRT